MDFKRSICLCEASVTNECCSEHWGLLLTLNLLTISIKVLGAPGGTNPILGDFGLCFFFKLSVLIPQTPKCDLVYFDFCSTFSLLKY